MNETECCRDICSSKEGTLQLGRGFTRYRSNDSGPDIVIVSDPDLKQRLRDFVDSRFNYQEAVQLITNDLAVLIEAGKVSEPERARLHDLTRKVRMTDEDLDKQLRCLEVVYNPMAVRNLVLELRDRYEERGKYAPAAPQVEPVQP